MRMASGGAAAGSASGEAVLDQSFMPVRPSASVVRRGQHGTDATPVHPDAKSNMPSYGRS
jgi:hypothetical protein